MKVAALSHALGPSLAVIAAASGLVCGVFVAAQGNPFSRAIRFLLTGYRGYTIALYENHQTQVQPGNGPTFLQASFDFLD
jgi:hypothetical protein